MAVSDFSETFADTSSPEQLICRNEKGEKLIAGYSHNARLKLLLKDKSEKTILSSSVKFSKDKIIATYLTKFWEKEKACEIALDEIETITIREMWIAWTIPYYDLDSLQNQQRNKMDSLVKEYATTDRLFLELIPKNKQQTDTIRVFENACYHLEIKNNQEFQYGIIQKITSDSITISTVFSPSQTNTLNKNSQFQFSLQDIKKINALKSGGIGVKAFLVSDYELSTKQSPKNLPIVPCWYSISRINGELYFYRLMLTEDGFKGIRYENDKYYWFEG